MEKWGEEEGEGEAITPEDAKELVALHIAGIEGLLALRSKGGCLVRWKDEVWWYPEDFSGEPTPELIAAREPWPYPI